MAPIPAVATCRIVEDDAVGGLVVANLSCAAGVGEPTNREEKRHSKSGVDACDAGRNTEVAHVDGGNDKPAIMRPMPRAGLPLCPAQSIE